MTTSCIDPLDFTFNRAIALSDLGHHDEALKALATIAGSSTAIMNARAVCLLRKGQTAAALRLFRSFVLQPGCTWMKTELPVIDCTNFSTALLLDGHPLGVRDTLASIIQRDHPSVVRLNRALRDWEHTLTWWQRFNWRFGLDPGVPVPISFVPGEFVDPPSASITTVSALSGPGASIVTQQLV